MIIVVTGTDTGVGKTYVAVGLVRALRARGLSVCAVKPFESGCTPEMLPANTEDGVLLARAAEQSTPTAALVRLRAPVAPPLAAEADGVTLDFAGTVRAIQAFAATADVTIVEGAGGLLSPLTWEHTALDLAVALGAHALVVAADRLGVLNHLRLCMWTLRAASVPIIGAVFSAPDDADATTGANAATYARLADAVPACTVARGVDPATTLTTLTTGLATSTAFEADAQVAGRSTAAVLTAVLDRLVAQERLRSLRPIRPISPIRAHVDDRARVLFSSNDYLGLSQHPEVVAAASEAVLRHGMGPRGSALVCGYTDAHAALESELAAYEGTEATLLTPTGYAANTALLGALGTLHPGATTIFSDALNHASIVDGCRLARAQVVVYRHRDMADLEARLAQHPSAHRIVVSDRVFGMDGTIAPVSELVALRRRHGFTLVLDEAHATLVLASTDPDLAQVDFRVGTLSKAFGCLGGFVATRRDAREWLLNVGRPFVFSTALPLPIVAAARAALAVAQRDSSLAERLWARVRQWDPSLATPIATIVLGTDRAALDASQRLFDAGFHVPAIRPPTVPLGTARLRIAFSAAHSEDDVARLARAATDLVHASRARSDRT